jgi:NADPH:quinone reductase-like Zn-dependent oxidoreductase
VITALTELRRIAMIAARLHNYGEDLENITIDSIPVPSPGPEEVLVEITAASLNPFDTTIRTGRGKESFPLDLPVTLGGDFSGTIREIGSDVPSFSPGDSVYGQASAVAGNSGAFAEFAVTKTSQVARAPLTVSLREAAALPLIGASALQALITHLQIQPSEKLFIHGGAGGIGSIAIQVAKHLGAYVATTATGEGIEDARNLGADEIIDYQTTSFETVLTGYDASFDTVGGTDFDKSLTVLKKGGRAVSMIAPVNESLAARLTVTATTQGTKVSTEALNLLTEYIDQGVISPIIDSTYELVQIRDAFEKRESGSTKGKILILPR